MEAVLTAEEIVQCSRCGFVANQSSPFCPGCGMQTGLAMPYPDMQSAYPAQTWPLHHHVARARGFSQLFGIHPGIAFLTLIVDLMLFGGDLVTAGALLPVSIGAGAMLGYISYLAQRKWYGDDKETALIKASILGLLTAIPVPLPAVLSLPAGLVGLVHNLRKK
jgi:hypothetical protein